MYSERTNGFDAKIIAENKRIPLLGLTGSMAAGKSTVSAMLAERGFFIVDADKTAHDVIQTEKVLRKLTDAFGEGILDESQIMLLMYRQLEKELFLLLEQLQFPFLKHLTQMLHL